MSGVDYGFLYKNYNNVELKPAELVAKIKRLLEDEEIGSKSGICTYVLTKDDKHLNFDFLILIRR